MFLFIEKFPIPFGKFGLFQNLAKIYQNKIGDILSGSFSMSFTKDSGACGLANQKVVRGQIEDEEQRSRIDSHRRTGKNI